MEAKRPASVGPFVSKRLYSDLHVSQIGCDFCDLDKLPKSCHFAFVFGGRVVAVADTCRRGTVVQLALCRDWRRQRQKNRKKINKKTTRESCGNNREVRGADNADVPISRREDIKQIIMLSTLKPVTKPMHFLIGLQGKGKKKSEGSIRGKRG